MQPTTTPDEKEEAINIRYIIHEKEQYSEARASEASLEFSRLEVQLAIVLLGLTGVFWNMYSSNLITVIDSENLVKFFFALVLFLLVCSLSLGLLHLKVTEKFWDQVSLVRTMRFQKWGEVISKKISYGEAAAYQEGTKIGNGVMIEVPKWAWILQSTLLGISIIIILVMAIMFIVLNKPV